MMKTFIKRQENFTCAHCGNAVIGNGYTNHCPECLWSRDVDINPGDRASECGGLMRPISITVQKDDYIILHKCEKCGKTRKQRADANDNINTLIAISADPGFIFGGPLKR